ncbi:hypothetical protein IGW_05321 [Bacillus cereus ISP3191]|uniref:hypothetical protein n=1 Tax=Bacillus cereus group TaxID=86661 RepID=UPI0002795224|nr:hypothetical protein [Bacillus cereus]EJQ86846.1 hypothetical protein IGW_05321 [Bacillus cereus ISP3191]MDR4319739.1 hypothetical protein [Bacillus paranthracis]
MFRLYGFLIAILLIGLQYFLSRRENVYWGLCLPILYVITLLYLGVTEVLSVKGNTLIFIIIILGGLAILLGIWIKGREDLKNKQKKELDRMKTKDIK